MSPLSTELVTEYTEALRRCIDLPAGAQLEVYDSCSWRRVGIRGDYKTLMQPVVASDGHPDIQGEALLRALVAAFNALPHVLAALRGSPCTCTSEGRVSIPASPDDYTIKHWCARCRALGLDK